MTFRNGICSIFALGWLTGVLIAILPTFISSFLIGVTVCLVITILSFGMATYIAETMENDK